MTSSTYNPTEHIEGRRHPLNNPLGNGKLVSGNRFEFALKGKQRAAPSMQTWMTLGPRARSWQCYQRECVHGRGEGAKAVLAACNHEQK